MHDPDRLRPRPRQAPRVALRCWLRLAATGATLYGLTLAPALAQSLCASDGQPPVRGLLERFIDAQCESCWADPQSPLPDPGALAGDWIVPSARGEAAPLAVAATQDAAWRLQALGRSMVRDRLELHMPVSPSAGQLRVAHGPVFNGYIGTSIAFSPDPGTAAGELTAWLLLVESIAPGTDGTPVQRNLVRNALQVSWNPSVQRRADFAPLHESRPMAVAEGARASRLRVLGWVQDGHGHILHIAQSGCSESSP